MQSRQAASRLGIGFGKPGVFGQLGGSASPPGAPTAAARLAALLVCDLTTELLGLLPDGIAARLVAAANSAAARAAESGAAVVYTRIELGGLAARPSAGRHPLLQTLSANGMIQAGSPGAALHPGLTLPPGATEIVRHRLSPFCGTPLDTLLRCHGVTDVAVAGLSTSGAVLTAARDAADLDYAVAVLSDASGNANVRAHKTAMEHIVPISASVVTTDVWFADLASRGAGSDATER